MKDLNELYTALSKAQGEFNIAKKDSDNPFYKSKYASMASIMEACRDALSKNGLCISQPIVNVDGVLCVQTILGHLSGQSLVSNFPLPELNANSKNPLQDYGKALTYLRRYALQSILNIAVDDDDGNSHENFKPSIQLISEKQCNSLIEVYSLLSKESQQVSFNALREIGVESFKMLPSSHFEGYFKFIKSLKVKEAAEFAEEVKDV